MESKLSHEPSETINRLKARIKNIVSNNKISGHYYAFWDFDGTLIRGDISIGKHDGLDDDYYGLLEDVILNGFVKNHGGHEGLKAFWDDYILRMKENYKQSHTYIAEMVHNLPDESLSRLKAFAHQQFDSRIKYYLYPVAMDLMKFMDKLGVRHCVISASPHVFVECASSYLPVEPWAVYGVGCDRHLPSEQQIINCGTGKAERAKQELSKAPSGSATIFAAGNHWMSDGDMIRMAQEQNGCSLLINEALPSEHSDQPGYFSLKFD